MMAAWDLLYDSIFQQCSSNSMMVDGRFAVSIHSFIFKLPCILAFVVQKSRIVVSFVEELKD